MRALLRGILIIAPVATLLVAGAIYGPDLFRSWQRERVRANLPTVARMFEKARLDFRRDLGRNPTLAELLVAKEIGPYTLSVLAAPLAMAKGAESLPRFDPVVGDDESASPWLSVGGLLIEPESPEETVRLGRLVVHPLAPPSSVLEWSVVLLPGDPTDPALVVWTDTSVEWIATAEFAERFAEINRRRGQRGRPPLPDPREVPDRLPANAFVHSSEELP